MKQKSSDVMSRSINHLNNFVSGLFPEGKMAFWDGCKVVAEAELKREGTTYDTMKLLFALFDRWNDHARGNTRPKEVGPAEVAVYSWAKTKIVYSFDKDVEDSFQNSSWDSMKAIPMSIFDVIPVDCFAIALNNPLKSKYRDEVFDTVIVMNNRTFFEDGSKSAGLMFGFTKSGMSIMYPTGIQAYNKDLSGFAFTVEESVENTLEREFKKRDKDDTPEFRDYMKQILPYVLYICSQNAEISQPEENKRIYRPNFDNPKHKYREVKQLVCGEPTGIRIRNFKKIQRERKESGTGSMKSPHVRRAHYHRYWVGKGEKRHIEIKWIAPMYIHKDLIDYIKPTNARVKKRYQ